MKSKCLYCANHSISRPHLVKRGFFKRKSDGQIIQRYRCLKCRRGFSAATFNACFRQNKRHKNEILRKLLGSGVSQRRAARVLKINRKTVVRKFLFLSLQAEEANSKFHAGRDKCKVMEFDDLETFEHSRHKPLSVTLAVEYGTRRILGFEVSQMAAKGPNFRYAIKKYGYRKDRTRKGRKNLFKRLKPIVAENATIKSDQHKSYPAVVKEFFPHATHITFKGRKPAHIGQGELKQGGFDPLFSLNHSCAMLRANINRLFRRTWCTTKRAARLTAHLNLYVQFHNESLI